jgi:hypothetical protein
LETEVSAPAVQLSFDYDQFGDSRDSMIQLACEIKFAGAVAAAAAFRIGEALREAQQLVPKGQWLKWLETEFQWSERKAYDLMSLPQNLGDLQKSANLDKLDYSAAVELARATSAPIRREVEVLLARGERVTFKRVIAMLGVREPSPPPKARRPKAAATPEDLALIVVGIVNIYAEAKVHAPGTVAAAVSPLLRRRYREDVAALVEWLRDLVEDLGDGTDAQAAE